MSTRIDNCPSDNSTRSDRSGERGSAIVIALFVLALISVFVAIALSRTSAETVAVSNETAETRTFYAAQGSLEMMTRNFNKIFEARLNPLSSDIDAVKNAPVPGLSDTVGGKYKMDQEAPLQTSLSQTVVLSGGPYSGLYAIRDSWRLRTTATDVNGVQVQLTRNVLNNRIPIFQFGIFYNDDLELFRPPRFSFGGRVHSNGNFFISPGADGVYFDSRVTAVGHIVTQSWRNWNQSDIANNQTWIKNASGTFKQLLPTMGSVLNTSSVTSPDNVFAFPPPNPKPVPTPNTDLPPSKLNPQWATQSAQFDGNIQAQVPALRLPMNVGANTDLIEMIKRGNSVGDLYNNNGTVQPVTAATADNDIIKTERFANKPGIRISLADSKAKLPGCASGTGTAAVTTPCGLRLDGATDGSDAAGPGYGMLVSGVTPLCMKLNTSDSTCGYKPTPVNGYRLVSSKYNPNNRAVWIKVETVQTNTVTGAIITSDITKDFLSMGVTEEAIAALGISGYSGTHSDNGTAASPSANIKATTAQTGTSVSTYPDSRSVIKLQTFMIAGTVIPTTGGFLKNYGSGSNSANLVTRFTGASATLIASGCPTSGTPKCTAAAADPNASAENQYHLKLANPTSSFPGGAQSNLAIVPFPIEMFDTREGTYYDDATKYSSNKVTRNGIMSMLTIDVANLRRFLRGDFDGLFQGGLTSSSIPSNNGWVVYVSDRRGDSDFDGKYAMEDIYGTTPNAGVLDPGEDIEPVGRYLHGSLLAKYINTAMTGCATPRFPSTASDCEAAKYADEWYPDEAAVNDHPYFRRGVRLINGTTIPGIYDATTSANTKGFTFASENGVYIWGNFNATGANTPPTNGNTPYNGYLPFNTPLHIPASIVADAVTVLSNNWNDAQSFTYPYAEASRVATTTQMRFALITGDTISTKKNAANQGSSVSGENENGGVHNFKRFLEKWPSASGIRLDYAGSLINLFNSRNNNGAFKCCATVYEPPVRNWVFDSTFLDPARIPPGTPYFQYVQTTGFQRTNE